MSAIEARWWGVIFFNFSDKNIWIGEGERLGQIVFERIAANLSLSEVSDFEERRPFAAAKIFDLQIWKKPVENKACK